MSESKFSNLSSNNNVLIIVDDQNTISTLLPDIKSKIAPNGKLFIAKPTGLLVFINI
jgi:hypothetical protein